MSEYSCITLVKGPHDILAVHRLNHSATSSYVTRHFNSFINLFNI